MSTQVVIPVKRLPGALRRLGNVLAPHERGLLQEAMLRDMLTACRDADGVDDVLVVTNDDTAAHRAAEAAARVAADHDPPRGMNAAVAIGQSDAAARGHRVLVLTADLPLVRPEVLATVIARHAPTPGVLLVPSHAGTGTNALLLDPPDAIRTRLGVGSRALHRAAAAAAGHPYAEVEVPRIALDIDTPEDLRRMLDMDPPRHTLGVCDDLGLGARLEAVPAA